MKKQRTFRVGGQKITIQSQLRTHMGNHAGWIVTINGVKYRKGNLEREDAEDSAYVQWVNDNT